MSMETATQYRRRARSMRTLASSIESLPLMRLDSLAGSDTWVGPRPFRTLNELRSYQHRLLGDAETLRTRALWLEQQATDMERVAALTGIA